MVPELMYDQAEIIKAQENLLNLYSFIDALIEKTNHNTVVRIQAGILLLAANHVAYVREFSDK